MRRRLSPSDGRPRSRTPPPSLPVNAPPANKLLRPKLIIPKNKAEQEFLSRMTQEGKRLRELEEAAEAATNAATTMALPVPPMPPPSSSKDRAEPPSPFPPLPRLPKGYCRWVVKTEAIVIDMEKPEEEPKVKAGPKVVPPRRTPEEIAKDPPLRKTKKIVPMQSYSPWWRAHGWTRRCIHCEDH